MKRISITWTETTVQSTTFTVDNDFEVETFDELSGCEVWEILVAEEDGFNTDYAVTERHLIDYFEVE